MGPGRARANPGATPVAGLKTGVEKSEREEKSGRAFQRKSPPFAKGAEDRAPSSSFLARSNVETTPSQEHLLAKLIQG
jgi:hypothetical protein